MHRIRAAVLLASLLAAPVLAQEDAERWLQTVETSEAQTQANPHDGLAWLRWGTALVELGDFEGARDTLQRADRELLQGPPLQRAAGRFALARTEAALGSGEAALVWLEKAAALGFGDLAALERDPGLAKLAGDPRHRAVVERLRASAGPRLDPDLSVALDVLFPPSPFRGHGRDVLAYELRIASLWPRELSVVGIEVLEDAEPPRTIASYQGAELAALLERPGDRTANGSTSLPSNASLIAFLWVPLEAGRPLPARLVHRVSFQGKSLLNAAVQPIVEGGAVEVGGPAIHIGAPLAGEGWVPRSSGSWSYHRRSLRGVHGGLTLAQRFAADWSRTEDVALGEDGSVPRDADFHTFGQDVLAVASGRVASMRDGSPDNELFEAPLVLEPDTGFGNHVVLDLGDGRFATYGHLQCGSVRVKPGERVRRGQVIAHVGASGDASGPHLHFHVSTSPSPYLGQGLPYVLESYAVLGWEDAKDAEAGRLPKLDLQTSDVRRGEMPIDNVIVRFL